MPLENTDVIDIISTSREGQKVLVITDAGVTTDPEERYALFMEKLKTYVAAIMEGALAEEFPASSPKNCQIRVVCALPPTEEMLAIQAIKPRGENTDAILVEFEMLGFGDDKPRKIERAPLQAPKLSEDLAGAIDFALTMGLESLKEGTAVVHAAVWGQDGVSLVVMAGFEDTREAARKYAVDLGPEVKAFAVCFEGKMSFEGRLVSAVIVEGSERGVEQGVAFGQRFQPKGFLKKFKVEGERIFLAHCESYLLNEAR